MAAIPSDLRKKARDCEVSSQTLLRNSTVSISSESTHIDLAEMRCKHYYKILSKNSTEPTSIKTWKINFADAFTEWQTKFSSSPENQVLCPLQSDPTMNQTEPTNFLTTIRVHRIPDRWKSGVPATFYHANVLG